MKKLLTLLGSSILITTSSIAVAACSNTSYGSVTAKAERQALLAFANENGILSDDIAQNTISFTNQPQKNYQQSILFRFHLAKNATLQDKTQLLATYHGTMLYNNKTQTFTLQQTPNPFQNPIYIPGIYDASLGVTSAIAGTYNAKNKDFTITSGSDGLYYLNNEIARATTTQQVFKTVQWKTPNEQKLANAIPISLLKELSNTPQAWQIPQNYMAVIHVVNKKIVWSNLQTEADKNSLNEVNNEVSSLVIKHSPSSLNLLISPSLAQEIIQIYDLNPDAQNSWFKTPVLMQWLQNNPNDVMDSQNGYLQAATVPKSSGYDDYNASLSEGVEAIQNLVSTPAIFASFTNLINNSVHFQADAYSLFFNLNNNHWIYQNHQSGVYPA